MQTIALGLGEATMLKGQGDPHRGVQRAASASSSDRLR